MFLIYLKIFNYKFHFLLKFFCFATYNYCVRTYLGDLNISEQKGTVVILTPNSIVEG